ncbi:MAG TPA: YceI family protein [Steroidobacteraceae bacterium]|nr:YceI family protein [Steroidobacteraceae bacterium]
MSTLHAGSRFPRRPALVAGWLLWGLAGCQTSPAPGEKPPPVPVVAPGVAAAGVVPAGAAEWHVVPEESLLQILVYRGGAMARLGHNHVISSHQVAGTVYVTGDPLQTRFDVSIPVNELTVDEPAMREMNGADFPPGVPQSARDGTRTNLLSEALLNGAVFPAIRLRATDVIEAANGYDIGVEITLKDQSHAVRVPVVVERAEGSLKATGEFTLKQSELGLQPFSVAMGTLVVLDEMKVRFDVTAKSGSVPH